jgi:hypothetical protein
MKFQAFAIPDVKLNMPKSQFAPFEQLFQDLEGPILSGRFKEGSGDILPRLDPNEAANASPSATT